MDTLCFYDLIFFFVLIFFIEYFRNKRSIKKISYFDIYTIYIRRSFFAWLLITTIDRDLSIEKSTCQGNLADCYCLLGHIDQCLSK